VESILDRLLVTEHEPEIVQISGGEPTIHPQILEILEVAKSRNIRHIMLNTNGIRLAEDLDFVRRLALYEPTIYLQFDGLTDRTHKSLRGCDLLAIKQKALDHLAEAGLYTILVATINQGINDNEIGAIAHYSLEHPAVLGVSYQPVTFCGRYQSSPDPLHRITLPDVLHRLEEQTLDFITNRTVINFSEEMKSALESLWSMATIMGAEKTNSALSCATCNLSLPSLDDFESLKDRFFMVQVHGFMDEYSFDLKRLMKCCVHQLLPDGRAIPLCSYNNLGYRQKMKEEA